MFTRYIIGLILYCCATSINFAGGISIIGTVIIVIVISISAIVII